MGAGPLRRTLSPSSSAFACWLGPGRAARALTRRRGVPAGAPRSTGPGPCSRPAPAAAPAWARCGRQPRPAPGAAANGLPVLPAPPSPSARARDAQKPHSACPGLRCAPAGGPTRRVCLRRANGAIVPPPDPEAQPSSQPRRGFEGAWKRGGVVVVRAVQLWEKRRWLG